MGRAGNVLNTADGRADRINRVVKSGLFDADWYCNRYPDVAACGSDPLDHFVDWGSLEGRSPGPAFDATWYLSHYADVREAGVEPFFHYLESGIAEKRLPIPKTAEEMVSSFWATDRKEARPRSWLEHKVMLDFLHQRVSGDPNIENCEWFKRQYFPKPVKLALSLGCGLGVFERRAIQLGIAERFHANDISSGAIETAKALAVEAGLAGKIEYSVVNLDDAKIPENTYDAIFAISSAHHVFKLENLFSQCKRALKPGGLMLLDEYIGPTRFQSSPIEAEVINKVLSILPSKYRVNLLRNDGSTIDRYSSFPLEEFERNDPSEAIRSGEIVNLLKLYFDILEVRPYGGGILHMLFSGIMGNFDESNETDVALLRILATFEETLEKTGAIATHFAAIVAKPKI